LDRRCTTAQIRAAYRALAREYHPDLHPDSADALSRTQALNAAYACLSDPARRRDHDRELDGPEKNFSKTRPAILQRNISQDVHLPLEQFLNGTTREVRVTDPGNPDGAEFFKLVVPPHTAPGTRFRLARTGTLAGGLVVLRVKPSPHFRFKTRGADLRCDLKIQAKRAIQGGSEMIRGLAGVMLRVEIPRGIRRGEILRIPSEGLPRPRGGRGDLLVIVRYRPEVRITRPA